MSFLGMCTPRCKDVELDESLRDLAQGQSWFLCVLGYSLNAQVPSLDSRLLGTTQPARLQNTLVTMFSQGQETKQWKIEDHTVPL